MVTFYSISTVRDSIINYLKKDTYTNCKNDLCIFFKDKSIDEIFTSPILLGPSNDFRYIKSRVLNSNFNTGKSGAYRLYYYVDIVHQVVYLLGFYPKTGKYGREDLSNTEEKIMIKTFKKEKNSKLLVKHDINDSLKEIKQEELQVVGK